MGLFRYDNRYVERSGITNRTGFRTKNNRVVRECHAQCYYRFSIPYRYYCSVSNFYYWRKWRNCNRLENHSNQVSERFFLDWFLIDSTTRFYGRYILRRQYRFTVQIIRMPQTDSSHSIESHHSRYECSKSYKGGIEAIQADIFLAPLRPYTELPLVRNCQTR